MKVPEEMPLVDWDEIEKMQKSTADDLEKFYNIRLSIAAQQGPLHSMLALAWQKGWDSGKKGETMKITGHLVCGSCKTKHPIFDNRVVMWGELDGKIHLVTLSGIKKFQCTARLMLEEKEKVLYPDHMSWEPDEKGEYTCLHFVEVPAMYWAEVPESSKG